MKKNEIRSKIIENKKDLSNVSSAMIHFSEKSWHLNFTDRSPKMWELPQITILRTNFKIVGTHTFSHPLTQNLHHLEFVQNSFVFLSI
ncbi:hypothetical protein LA733_2654 [Leptospira interrogans]|nr:hypothetical protein LA733_2654 [Leptospira interrogans]KWV25629.1 hypothetical protein LA702_2511 [Leptospira interrogans]